MLEKTAFKNLFFKKHKSLIGHLPYFDPILKSKAKYV